MVRTTNRFSLNYRSPCYQCVCGGSFFWDTKERHQRIYAFLPATHFYHAAFQPDQRVIKNARAGCKAFWQHHERRTYCSDPAKYFTFYFSDGDEGFGLIDRDGSGLYF